ncbi:sugar transferase [Granulicella arctica]|uniref:Exopolysaccharide biosynthesis polyprenyl glycosylphosphotransferase n=1 Tax=Granulicella arctica TaxID=940613 RepID=A0A7Y9PGT1_9BACT|nr:sugar transferase [Granulicella arctica]NYF79624.1 exopolysaccharide biosynthesis polyprenyl glycosylphosphotransferase [Granulicella arctica]
MTPANRKSILELVKIGDIGLLFLCLSIAYLLASHRQVFDLLNSLETRHPIQVFIATILLAFAWYRALLLNGFYTSRRLEGHLKEVLDIGSASSLSALFCFVWLWLISFNSNRSLAELITISIIFGILSFSILLLTRLIGRATMYAFRSRGHNLRHILIVGTNRRAISFAQGIDFHPEWGYRLQGFVDTQWWDEQSSHSTSKNLLGDFGAIPSLLRSLPVDEVVVALPLASFYQQIAEIVVLCRHHGIVVRSIGTFFNQEQAKGTEFVREAVTSITLHDESWDERASMIKRSADIVVSSILLLALAPLLLTIAILIKFTSTGPVLFSQTRVGYGKRPFQIRKFRTMVQDAEKLISQVEHLNETQGPTFKLKNDPRITPFGKFLRKTSLDELPQLINVLIGDMSLVGPRPLPLRDYQGFSQDSHRRRFSVKPGITCLWQVMGRSSIGFDEWMDLDIRYIDQWSVWLDIKILFQTIPAVFRGSGAV